MYKNHQLPCLPVWMKFPLVVLLSNKERAGDRKQALLHKVSCSYVACESHRVMLKMGKLANYRQNKERSALKWQSVLYVKSSPLWNPQMEMDSVWWKDIDNLAIRFPSEINASWNQWSPWSRHSPRPRLSRVATRRPGICLVTRHVHTAHQWTHHLTASGCQLPRLISLAAFSLSDGAMGDERSGEAEDHELSYSQERYKKTKKDGAGLKKRKKKWMRGRRERQIEIWVLLFEEE